MRKKVLAVLMVLVLSVTFLGLTACGNNNVAAPDPTPAPAPTPAPTPDEPAEEVPDENGEEAQVPATDPGWDPNNDDLMGDGLGDDFGLGPVGHDLEALVERMGRDFVASLRIGVPMNAVTTDWQLIWMEEMQGLADRFGFEAIILSAENDPAQQVADFRSLQAQQVDGMAALVFMADALASTITEMHQAGIPIVNGVDVTPETEISAYLTVSQTAKGAMIADQVQAWAEARGEDAYVLTMGTTAFLQVLEDRNDGFLERAAQLPNVHIVDNLRGESMDDRMGFFLDSMLINEEVNVIFSSFTLPFHEGLAASRQLGREVAIFAVDSDDLSLELLATGEVDGGVHPQFPNMNASLTLFTLLRVINGDNVPRQVSEPDLYAMAFSGPEDAEHFLNLLWRR